jgi:hypothetical protein
MAAKERKALGAFGSFDKDALRRKDAGKKVA